MISAGSLFSRQSAPLLGIDISSSSVKLVELGRDKAGGLVLERCAIEPLERGWITDGNIEKFDEVAEALRRLVKKSGTRTKNVALALPPSAVITKKITLPAGMSDQELEVQVESEANQYIPFSLDEVSLDFCVMGPSKNAPGDVEVLIAASRREKVQDRQGLAEAAGLTPATTTHMLDQLAVAGVVERKRNEAFPNKGVDTMVALFEVGALTTSMQVIRNDEVLYDRDQAFGGAQLSQLIVRQYGFSAEEAESKKRSGDLPDDYSSAVLRPFVESLSQEIGRALQFFFTSTPHNRVDRMRSSHAEVSAVILINLLPHREAARKRRRETFQATMLASVLVGLVIAGAIYWWFQMQIEEQQGKNQFLQSEIKILEGQIKEIATIEEEIAALRARQKAVEDLQSDRNLPVHLLSELVQQLPDGVYITTLKQTNQTVAMQGMAQSNERVSEMLRNLSNNTPWLSKPELVEIVAANVALTPRDQRRVSAFNLRFQLMRSSEAQKAMEAASVAGK